MKCIDSGNSKGGVLMEFLPGIRGRVGMSIRNPKKENEAAKKKDVPTSNFQLTLFFIPSRVLTSFSAAVAL